MSASQAIDHSLDLRGHGALVSGGGVRLGAELARSLAGRGAAVAVHYHRSRSAAEQVVADIQAAGGRACHVAADLSRDASVAGDLIAEATGQLGLLSILINSAATFESSSLGDLNESEWDRTLSLNLKAPAFLCQAFAQALPPDRAGAIVNIVDWRATHPCPGHLSYTIAKAGLAALTRLLAQELGPRNIRVNAVAPGAILPAPGQDPREFDALRHRIPLGRVGGPADVVQAVLYLLSAPYVTGEIIHVTGGEQLGRS